MITIRGTVTVLDPAEQKEWALAWDGLNLAVESEPKEDWSTPAIQILELSAAQGAHPGPLCDRFGSLSHGGGACS